MPRLMLAALIFSLLITGCYKQKNTYTSKDIVKVTDFALSADEEKIAFSAVTPAGNLDIWVMDIDGKNLRKLTFQDHSLTNYIAKFFKKYRWRNFFEIDMCCPEWTTSGRILFCQKLTRYDMWGPNVVSLRYWTVEPDGIDKKPKTSKDIVAQKRPFDPINRAEISLESDKHKKKVFLKDGKIFISDYGK
ncbi:MAG: hypothetical protein WC312_05480 [Candidatus Omnitrophota bacterium]|jgi:hypothetical protein